MKVNTKVRYGLRAILQIAEGFGKDPVSISSISEFQEISGKMSQVASTLKEALDLASRAVSRDDLICVSGSFYLVGEAKQLIQGK